MAFKEFIDNLYHALRQLAAAEQAHDGATNAGLPADGLKRQLSAAQTRVVLARAKLFESAREQKRRQQQSLAGERRRSRWDWQVLRTSLIEKMLPDLGYASAELRELVDFDGDSSAWAERVQRKLRCEGRIRREGTGLNTRWWKVTAHPDPETAPSNSVRFPKGQGA